MLADLVSGARSLRGPLVAGALLVASLLTAFTHGSNPLVRQNLGPGLQHLHDLLGQRGLLAVTLTVAYLVGSVFVSVRNLWVRNLSARSLRWYLEPAFLYKSKKSRFEAAWAPLSRPSARRIGMIHQDAYDQVTATRVAVDLIYSRGRRLQVANSELYNEYDQLKSEAVVRDAAALPGLCFVGVALVDLRHLTFAVVGLAVLAALLCLAMLVQARSLDREANSIFAHAIADGVASVPAIDNPDRTGRRNRWTAHLPQ